MTLGRTGLGARTTFHSLGRSAFTRDRTDGGGGASLADDAGDITDDVDDAGDVTEDDANDDDDDDDDSGDDAALGDAGKRALRAERDKVKAKNREIRELRAQLAAKGKPKADAEDTESDEDRAARETERARELAKPMIVRSEARSKLAEAGVIGDPARALRLLDLSEVEVTYSKTGDVDEIDGLDDEIEKLTEDYPELFKPKRGGGGRIDGADRRTDTATKKKSASEIQAAGLRGGR